MTFSFRQSLMLAVVLATATGCTMPDPAVEDARARIAPTLPAPYFEDLVTESVSVRGKRLVFLVRSPEGDADRTRDNPRFEELRMSEQRELRRLCAMPEIAPLRDTDAILVRRFVDRSDKPFFEVAMPARDCPPDTGTAAPATAAFDSSEGNGP